MKDGGARLPAGLPLFQLLPGEEDLEEAVFHVNPDAVALFQKGDRPAHKGLGGDVADHEAPGAPEKRPSVRRATSGPRPSPTMALVTESISGMPGAPLGPT